MTAPTPMFPLQSALLPGESLPLRVFEPRYSALVRACLDTDDPAFGVVLIARGREVGGGDERHDVGALARIVQYADHGAGRYQLKCSVQERFRVTEWLPDDPFPRAVIEQWPDEPGGAGAAQMDTAMAALEDDIWSLLEFLAAARDIQLTSRDSVLGALPTEPGARLYALAGCVPIGPADRYAVLAAPGPTQRLTALREAVETVDAMARFQASNPD
ncbi:ATP-dependent protease [Mycolicibacterium chitae]|uniref:LON peptidase substrate-binding domain-containing protein n=1 Tax=Mycolicibacterium TaxID=1866885 RepID=UPI000F84CE28|nr:LON peptidase substrate-binding domain-containing protein [Mycolicibacterium chitae]MCV7106077.1 LON peptidase substrate-binding domain-containing protein [Mycolicibacterium chitae]BBZ01000.1 ATP-dependent protease [Mycolicibacterium chitae]